METLKEKVGADVEKQWAEYLESGAFVQNNVLFNPDFRLDETNKSTAKQLFDSISFDGYKQEQKFDDFEILLANLLDQNKKPISISLNRNSWRKTQYHTVTYSIIDMVHKLNELKLIDMRIGNNIKDKPSRMTRIWANKELFEIFPLFRTGVILKPYQLVILRDEHRKLKAYKDTAETNRIRSILERINEVNSKVITRF